MRVHDAAVQGNFSRRRRSPTVALGAILLGILALALPLASSLADEVPDGFRSRPTVGWKQGDHSLDLKFESRLRYEMWDAHANNTDGVYAARSRISATYRFGEKLAAFAEFQDARVYSLSPDKQGPAGARNTNGAAGLYRANAQGTERTRSHHDRLRQLWIEFVPFEGVTARIGRTSLLLGTQVKYKEPNWNYLKIKRTSQRLVGDVGWTHSARSTDGFTLTFDDGDHNVFAFAVKPTTGVFDIEDAYKRQDDIKLGGVSWTVRRDVFLPKTELRFFGIGYKDDRPVKDGGRFHDTKIWTLGAQSISVIPCGPGNIDLLFWGAGQWGDFTLAGSTTELNQKAWASLVEVGYQFTEAPMKPWIRLGLNIASGDKDASDPTDDDHEAFFNLVPTNHLYYGYADRFALSNLVDWFIQLKLVPVAKMGLELTVHQFGLQTDDDGRHFGTGAFNRSDFGYGLQPSRGHDSVGTELDLVVTYKLNDHVSLAGGYSHLYGRGVLNHEQVATFSDDDVRWGFLQAQLSY
jgi:hypothetical protein